jgi:hypothetical protein
MSLVNPKQMAQAVATLLNGGSFSVPFQSQVLLKPLFDLTDLGDLKVTVVPVSLGLEKIARGLCGGQYEIDIAVQQKLPTETMDSLIESLMDLVLEIALFLDGTLLEYEPGKHAAALKTEIKPIYSMEHLAEYKVFTSVVAVAYKVM